MFLVREEQAPRFIAIVRQHYFVPLVQKGVVKEEELGSCLFATKPSSGAAVMRIKLAAEPVDMQPVAVAAAAAGGDNYEI